MGMLCWFRDMILELRSIHPEQMVFLEFGHRALPPLGINSGDMPDFLAVCMVVIKVNHLDHRLKIMQNYHQKTVRKILARFRIETIWE